MEYSSKQAGSDILKNTNFDSLVQGVPQYTHQQVGGTADSQGQGFRVYFRLAGAGVLGPPAPAS